MGWVTLHGKHGNYKVLIEDNGNSDNKKSGGGGSGIKDTIEHLVSLINTKPDINTTSQLKQLLDDYIEHPFKYIAYEEQINKIKKWAGEYNIKPNTLDPSLKGKGTKTYYEHIQEQDSEREYYRKK